MYTYTHQRLDQSNLNLNVKNKTESKHYSPSLWVRHSTMPVIYGVRFTLHMIIVNGVSLMRMLICLWVVCFVSCLFCTRSADLFHGNSTSLILSLSLYCRTIGVIKHTKQARTLINVVRGSIINAMYPAAIDTQVLVYVNVECSKFWVKYQRQGLRPSLRRLRG